MTKAKTSIRKQYIFTSKSMDEIKMQRNCIHNLLVGLIDYNNDDIILSCSLDNNISNSQIKSLTNVLGNDQHILILTIFESSSHDIILAGFTKDYRNEFTIHGFIEERTL